MDPPRTMPLSDIPIFQSLLSQETFAAKRLWNSVISRTTAFRHKGNSRFRQVIETHGVSLCTIDRKMVIESLMDRRCYNRLFLLERLRVSLMAALNYIFQGIHHFSPFCYGSDNLTNTPRFLLSVCLVVLFMGVYGKVRIYNSIYFLLYQALFYET